MRVILGYQGSFSIQEYMPAGRITSITQTFWNLKIFFFLVFIRFIFQVYVYSYIYIGPS